MTPAAQVMNYVPNEVCLVVKADNVKDPAALYESVRAWVNTRVGRLLAAHPDATRRPDPLDQDLDPTTLRERRADLRQPLQPLRRSGVAASDKRGVAPWRSLPRRERGASTWHLYYQLGRDPGRLDQDRRVAADLALVREVVLLTNRALIRQPMDDVPWSIVAASPNWLTNAAPFTCGSPGGSPAPPPDAKRWRFKFGTALQRSLRATPAGEVVVAVLDTCPSQQELNAAAQRFPRNDLLQQVRTSVRMNMPAILPDAYYSGGYLDGCLLRWQEDMATALADPTQDRYSMADHGLFVTGIISDILSPRVPIYLVRVLNEYGVGDLLSITHVLAELPRRLATGTRRLVVNLSLGSDLPIPERFLERWLPQTAANPDTLRKRMYDVCKTLDLVHANQHDVVDWLSERGVVVVAAAGNDALRSDVTPGDPPPPRFPARYDSVLGVASVRSDLQQPATYSNRGDVVVFGNGVATFGGNVRPPGSDTKPPETDATVDPATQRTNAVVGIFSQPRLPITGATNDTGWAAWAGTSFATPVATAIAARIWEADPTLTPQQVIDKVRALAQPAPGADVLEAPVLQAFQAH
jgi:hypothetical protein